MNVYVTMRRFRMNTVAVEKEEVLQISSMCNFSYPARTAHLP